MTSRAGYFATVEDTRGGVSFVCRCGERLRLMLHHDAKTSPGVRIEPSGRAVAVVANAWPLPAGPLEHGGTCPGWTRACVDCYAAGLEAWAPGFRRGAAANLAALEHLYGCGGVRLVSSALVDVVESSAREQRARGVERGVAFRWHSDGDFFADWYARAVRRAIEATADHVEHWAYTRTLSAVRILEGTRGLRLYVSVDEWNLERAARVASRYGVPVAVLASDPAHASSLWARLAAAAPALLEHGRPITCPASSRWVNDGVDAPAHVVGEDGRRASARRGSRAVGACISCRVCLPSGSGRHVTFLVHGGRARAGSSGRLGAAVTVRRRDLEAVRS